MKDGVVLRKISETLWSSFAHVDLAKSESLLKIVFSEASFMCGKLSLPLLSLRICPGLFFIMPLLCCRLITQALTRAVHASNAHKPTAGMIPANALCLSLLNSHLRYAVCSHRCGNKIDSQIAYL